MLVPDWTASERGPQRRKAADGRLLHCCCVCGRLEAWSARWSTFCSYKELDDEVPIPKFCSEACRQQAGDECEKITAEMKRKASEAEWREPAIVYREATEREKYDAASRDQRRRRRRPSPQDRP